MNLPNKLTVLRILMVPVIVAVLLIPFPYHWAVALLLFAAASYTDHLDGYLARKNNLITDFGKFADPLADKVLVFSVLCCFLKANFITAVVLIVLLAREFMVTAVRLSAAAGGKVVAASFWAKAKTVSQMIAILVILALAQCQAAQWFILPSQVFFWICEGLMWVTAVFSIVSGVQYVIANIDYIKTAK